MQYRLSEGNGECFYYLGEPRFLCEGVSSMMEFRGHCKAEGVPSESTMC